MRIEQPQVMNDAVSQGIGVPGTLERAFSCFGDLSGHIRSPQQGQAAAHETVSTQEAGSNTAFGVRSAESLMDVPQSVFEERMSPDCLADTQRQLVVMTQ